MFACVFKLCGSSACDLLCEAVWYVLFCCGIVCVWLCVFFDLQVCLCVLFVNDCEMLCVGVLCVVWGVCVFVCLVYTNMFVRFVRDLLCDVVCVLCDSTCVCDIVIQLCVCLWLIV